MEESKLGLFLMDLLQQIGVNQSQAVIIKGVTVILLIIFVSLLANWVTKRIIISIISQIIKRSKNQYDDIFLEKRVFNNLSQIVPALIVHYTIHLAIPQYPQVVEFIQSLVYVYMTLVVLLVINSTLNAIHEIYKKTEMSREFHIKGYIQVLKIILFFIGGILIISFIIGRSPAYLFTGLGAMAAVLLLVFRDTILGFVASIQLSSQKIVKPGDWISMPSHNADGTVIDISITTVKVQNWDKTISTIPTYHMVSQAFVNWKGMEQSGGRQIKRHLLLDLKSIRFLTSSEIDQLQQNALLGDFFNSTWFKNRTQNHSYEGLNNFTLFRDYTDWFVKNHPHISTSMLNVVRQLQPQEHGLPLQILVFSKKQAFVEYETFQADIMDHLFAVARLFQIAIYQAPSGSDIRVLQNSK